jgi:hypothetical protein
MTKFFQHSSETTVSGRYSLAVLTVQRAVVEAPMAPKQCQALASYQYPTSRIHCCSTPAPIPPSDATEWVL